MDVLSLDTTDNTIPSILSISDFTEGEAEIALKPGGPEAGQTRLKNLKASHHRAARLIAAGAKPADVARKTGYTTGTIQTLNSNPAFKELVQHYSGEYDETVDEIAEQMQALARDILSEVQSRLDDEDSREEISITELKGLLDGLLDRSGHGPVKRVEKHSIQESRSVGIIQHVRAAASERRYGVGSGHSPGQFSLSESRGIGMGRVLIKESAQKVSTKIEVSESGFGI